MTQKRITPLEKIVKTLRQLILEKDEEIIALREILNRRDKRLQILEETLKSKKADSRRARNELLTKKQ